MANYIKIMRVGKKWKFQIHHRGGTKISRKEYRNAAEAQADAVQMCDVFFIDTIAEIEVEDEEE